MKKILGVILILLTVLSLCGCGSVSPDPSPDPGPEPQPEPDLSEELYDRLNGVWVRKDGYETTFLTISKENGKVCYSAGVPFSDFIFGGPVDDVVLSGNMFSFTVHVAERKADELSSGWSAYDMTVKADITRIGESIIKANDCASDGSYAEFTRFADDMDSADWNSLLEGDTPSDEFDTALADELWTQLYGIWLTSVNGEHFFSDFTCDTGIYSVSQGVPASGFVIGANATYISKNGNTYLLDLHAPERHDSGEGAEMDYDAFDVHPNLTVNGDGTIDFNLWVDSGETATWEFWAEDWDSVDWDAYFGLLSEG